MVDDDIMKYIPEDITFIAELQDSQVICTRVSAWFGGIYKTAGGWNQIEDWVHSMILVLFIR